MNDRNVREVRSLGRSPTTRLDDLAYVLPMGLFLGLTFISGKWPDAYPWTYVLKTVLAAGVLAFFWKRYTTVRWNAVGLGVIVGVIGLVQWVGMEKLLLHFAPGYPRPDVEIFNPFARDEGGKLVNFSSVALAWGFVVFRWAGAVLVVPVMEELFWRDYLWRTLQSPNDFKLPEVGEWEWMPFAVVSAAFASVHVQWITAFAWGAMIAWLLVRTKSIGACIVAHAVTNLLLGAYVLVTGDWYFW